MAASKLEYLKKYMESGEESKKKRVRKIQRALKNPNVKIFDTNVDLKDVKAGSDSDDPTIEDIREDGPEVADIIDERPLEMRSFKKTFQDVSSRRSHDSDGDTEHVRRNRRDSSNEDSPPRRASRVRRDSSDESPPRKRNARRDSSDESPPRRRRGDSSEETIPRRKSGAKRAGRRDSDESPPRRKRDTEASSRKSSDIDSPPRRPRRPVPGDREIVPCEVIDGPQTVSLRKNDKNEEQAAAKREQAEKEARRKAIYDKWQSGIVQQQQKQSHVKDFLIEANKPLARNANDADLDERLKEVEREGDTMLAFLKKKKKSSNAEPSRPRYKGPEPPPNRYNIWPGYRWDGVDRSNGFEAKMMSMATEKMANEEQAYKWSIEDM